MKIAISISDCIDKCTIDVKAEQIAACAYICEMDHGYANPQFLGTFPTQNIKYVYKHCLSWFTCFIDTGF